MPEGRIRLRGAPVDRATQRWVIRTGTKLALAEEEWLAGPVGAPEEIGESWIEQHAARVGASMAEEPDGGLLPRLDVLDGGDFRAGDLHPTVRNFYEHTARWQLDVWSRWARWAEPGGRLLNAVFARRLRQLGLPLDPLEVAYGMATRVVHLRSATGVHLGTAWQRSLRSTGATVFGGLYSITDVPPRHATCDSRRVSPAQRQHHRLSPPRGHRAGSAPTRIPSWALRKSRRLPGREPGPAAACLEQARAPA